MSDESVTIELGERRLVAFEEVRGDLSVEGGDQSTVSVEVQDGQPAVEQSQDAVHVHVGGDATVKVPASCSLRFNAVAGDVRIQGVAGELTGQSVAGDLVLENVGPASLGAVAGDLWARDVHGALHVDQVGGDADLAGVAGDVTDVMVGGDLMLADVQGNVRAQVGADAVLRLSPEAGRAYTVTAGADLACIVPADAGLDVSATSGAGVLTDLSDQELGSTWQTVLGGGGAALTLRAGAEIWLGSGEGPAAGRTGGPRPQFSGEVGGEVGGEFGEDLGHWADDFAKRMRDHAGSVAEEIATRLGRVAETLPDVLVAAGMSSEEAERIAMRVQRSAERASERMDIKMREMADRVEARAARASERAARHAERAARRAEHPAWRHAWYRAPQPPRSSEEERMAILRMVEEGKISVEDAAKLLAALDGRSA